METTTNYEMRKPEYTDTADIADINYNTDKIDEVLKTLDDRTDPVDVAHGGTGQTTVAAARNALGLGNTNGALPVANGGTGMTGLTNDSYSSSKGVFFDYFKWGRVVMVYISGKTNASVSKSASMCTLPAAYRPKHDVRFAVDAGGDWVLFQVDTSGHITCESGAISSGKTTFGTITYISNS